MFKDKDKQREAIKAATQRYRAKKGDSALSGSKVVSQNAPGSSVVDEVCDTQPVIPKCDTPNVIPKQTFEEFSKTHVVATLVDPNKPKRGKDIKCFDDLSPSVQQTINTLSDDKAEHKRRTAIAINYQHQFPDRYHSTGCDVFKRRQGKLGAI